MKKKLSLLGLVLILVLSLAGCGSKTSEEQVYDEAVMEQYANVMISSFSSMSDEDFAQFQDLSDYQLDYMLMSNGLPIASDDFLSMIEAWEAGQDECGTIESIDAFSMETSNSGASLSAEFKAAERNGEIVFAFDEKMNMESLTINAEYSIGEILTKAGLNTVLGMGTVFVVLIFISFIISLFKYIPAIQEKFSKKKAAETSKESAPAPEAPVQPQTDDSELVAAIAAAIAAYEGTTTDGFVVRSIKRRKSNKWS